MDFPACQLQRGHTLVAMFTLGCPATAVLLAHGHSSGLSVELQLEIQLQIPSPQFWACRPLRNVIEHMPRRFLRWTNYWHPQDATAYPLNGVLNGARMTDVAVKLNDRGGDVGPLDYIGQLQRDYLQLSYMHSMWPVDHTWSSYVTAPPCCCFCQENTARERSSRLWPIP